MTRLSRRTQITLFGVLVLVALPVFGHWFRARSRTPSTCALDGMKIDPSYRVEIVTEDSTLVFCCVRCAELRLDRRATIPRQIVVTDEPTGHSLAAEEAVYVRSSIVTTATTGNRIHVFRSQADAEKHADRFGGVVLSEAEQPFLKYRMRKKKSDE